MNKNVLSKLSKIESNVELSDVKVDLNMVKDIMDAMTEMRNLNIKSDQFKSIIADKKKEVDIAKKNFKEHLDAILFQARIAQNQSERLKQETDKLGIPLPEIAKTAPKNAKEFEKIVANDRKNYAY